MPDNTIDYATQILQLSAKYTDALERLVQAYKQLEAVKPVIPADKDCFWHVATGTLSIDAANSDDLELLLTFQRWLNDFAYTYIKPYVASNVYAEILNQMSRGLPERIALLKTQKEIEHK